MTSSNNRAKLERSCIGHGTRRINWPSAKLRRCLDQDIYLTHWHCHAIRPVFHCTSAVFHYSACILVCSSDCVAPIRAWRGQWRCVGCWTVMTETAKSSVKITWLALTSHWLWCRTLQSAFGSEWAMRLDSLVHIIISTRRLYTDWILVATLRRANGSRLNTFGES